MTDRPGPSAPLRLALLMISVSAAYYLGSRIGLALRIPPATTSVLWPPNTVLTLALMLTPPRRWAWMLAAALSAHLAVQAGTGWQPLLILGFFATNSLEAILGAGAFRWLAGTPPRIDTLRRMTIFIAAVAVGASILSSFPDAAAVSWFRGEPFGLVMFRRVTSNILTTLALLPALLVLCLHLPRWLQRTRPRRWLEAGALTACLVVATQLAAFPLVVRIGEVPVTLHTPLVLLLPFLLWAAVRFGTAGASLSLLVTTLSSVRGAIVHAAYADSGAAETSVVTLQAFLIMLAIPLLCLAALVEERYRARVDLADRLAFEGVLARVSAMFVHVPTDDIPSAFHEALDRLGRFVGLHGLVLVECHAGESGAQTVASWTPVAAASPALASLGESCPWMTAQLLSGSDVAVASMAELPIDAVADRRTLEAATARAALAIPLVAGGRVVGGLVCLAASEGWPRDQDVIGRLRQAGDVFGNALARKQTDGALRDSEGMKSAILAALPNAVAVLDESGHVRAVNKQWQEASVDRSLVILVGPVATSYLDHCRAVEIAGVVQARDVVDGVGAVLAGQGAAVTVEYCARPLTLDRWFSVTIVPLGGTGGGAVLTHTEITERRRTELSTQRSRDELAHVTRVAAMGELAASLAHELSQPLSGILSHAQAAQKLVTAPGGDLHLVAGLLADIVDDDRRAADVIERLRALLRKGPATQVRLDVNAVVSDVLKLVQGDADARNIPLVAELSSAPLVVLGDRVQLAQALLNLIANALDALGAIESSRRRVRVTTEAAYEAAVVVVHDTGPGLGDDPEALFAPFFSTKRSGIGMGLPIARTIVETHGGRVWAANSPGGVGASAYVSLPLAVTQGQ